MGAAPEWRNTFPLETATAASEALLEGWRRLASLKRQDFNSSTVEPALTKRLKIYVENVLAPERGLLGMWAAEDIIGDLNPSTGELLEERRTDIAYGWNNDVMQFRLVFEFKRLKKGKWARDQYLGEQGLARFVTGKYSRGQAIAAMVGVLLEPEAEIVPPIQAALAESAVAKMLRLRKAAGGQPYTKPSIFPEAAFDTEHDRNQPLAPPHGYICVAHFFVRFE
ncbi:MAG: Fis family transcriptional regulator [Gammaproteobacteria bacterium]|nr:Fis family transcriptional regulator [Gammaproteobacteria bacterium]